MQVNVNGVTLEVDDQGPTRAQPLVLIMGLGMQLVAWPDGFVDELLRAGFRVIRFDNRDIGLSQSFDAAGTPNLLLQAVRHGLGLPLSPAYRLADLADDTAALLDALKLTSAHVCGASMGGMVAQHLAARHPHKVRSLSLMMTTSGARHLPKPRWKVTQALLNRPKPRASHDELVEHMANIYSLIGSPAYPPNPVDLRRRISAAVHRSHRPRAVVRQLVAIAADGDRTPMLTSIKAVTQVIHGDADPLVPPAAGTDLARWIAGAELDLISGMGHDLPEPLWPRLAANVREAAQRWRGCQGQ